MRSAGTQVPEREAPAKSTKRGRGRNKQVDVRARDTRMQNDRSVEMDRSLEDQPYVRPSSLGAPTPLPGMKQRWVDVGVEGKWNDKNWARRQREGWVPRPSNTVPKSFPVPRVDTGRFAGAIGVEGMVLCHMTIAQAMKRKRYYTARTKSVTAAINDDIRKVNRTAGGGFGPIRKAEKSSLVREARVGDGGSAEAQEVEL